MKREITQDDLIQLAVKLKNKFVAASPAVQKKILLQLSEIIENLEDVELKDAFAQLRSHFEGLTKQTEPADLEEIEKLKDDHSAFFEAEEKHRAETLSALEEMAKTEETG